MAQRISKRAAERVRRTVLEDEKRALADLAGHPLPPDESVHEARKRLKEARAGLRLLRDALGDATYRRENRLLRDAARPLGAIRDARILIESFDKVLRGERRRTARDRWRPLREILVAHHSTLRRTVGGGTPARAAFTTALRAARDHAGGWKLQDATTLRAGMKRVYRSGRRAMRTVQRDASVANLHEWRKQSKYLWNQLRILADSKAAQRLAERAHRLSDLLGADHDLAMLERFLHRSPRMRRHPTLATALAARIEPRRLRLQAQARELGSRIYAPRPRRLAAKVLPA